LVLMSAGLVWTSFIQVTTPYWFFIAPMALVGGGFGIGNPARTQVVLSTPPVDLISSASAVNTAVAQSGYSLGVILSSVIIASNADAMFLAPLESAGISPARLSQVRASLPSLFNRTASGDYPNLPKAVLEMSTIRYDQAFTASMGQMFLVIALMVLIAAILIYLGMRRNLIATVAQMRTSESLSEEKTVS
jgi:hypothetical protein